MRTILVRKGNTAQAGRQIGRNGQAAREDESMKDHDVQFAYVDHMQSEHLKLDQLIRRTLASVPTWEELDAADWLARMKNGLVQIHIELAHHFRDEEQGGCLEEAVARCPKLSAEVQRIESHHDELLSRLSDLIDRCQCGGKLTAQQSRALEQELRQVVRELRSHEALENKIMQEGFGMRQELADVSQPTEMFRRCDTPANGLRKTAPAPHASGLEQV